MTWIDRPLPVSGSLSTSDVRRIRKQYAKGVAAKVLATEYAVHSRTIRKIVNRKLYRRVD